MSHDLAWMSRPFAHRGLHNAKEGIIENTRSSVSAALEHGFGIEVDLHLAACGTVMVFHDDMLERLTHGTGAIADKSKEQLQAIDFRDTSDKMMSLQDLFDLVNGRVPLLLEIKSNWHKDTDLYHRFVTAIIAVVEHYKGPFAIMSFDPTIVSTFRQLAPSIPRGLISEGFGNLEHWHYLTLLERMSARFLLSFTRTRPDFIAYDINALPAIAPLIAKAVFKRPLLTWTVRTDEQRQRAEKYCDAMIFETLRPQSR